MHPLGRLALAVVLSGSVVVASCATNPSGFEQDPNSASSTGTVGTCNPQISELEFLKGEWEDIGYYIRVRVAYKTRCFSDIEDGEVYVKITNLDANDPESDEANAEYRFGVAESKYVDYDTATKTIWVDFLISDDSLTTTYLFKVKIKDSDGYWSNELEEDVVYNDIDESVDGDSGGGSPTPTPGP